MNNMQLALIHSSYNPRPGENNQRLEYLGDSILDMLAAEYLYTLYPTAREGFLTGARAELVCEGNLARVGRRMNLGDRLILGRAELGQNGKTKPSILADAVEAQIGAMYLDYGLETTRKWVTNNILAYRECSIERIG